MTLHLSHRLCASKCAYSDNHYYFAAILVLPSAPRLTKNLPSEFYSLMDKAGMHDNQISLVQGDSVSHTVVLYGVFPMH